MDQADTILVRKVMHQAEEGLDLLISAREPKNRKAIDLDIEKAIDRKHSSILKGAFYFLHKESMLQQRQKLLPPS